MSKNILKEEGGAQTVNEVQLKDLYTEASRTEMQIIKLAELAINFSDNKIKQSVMGLSSKAHELRVLIGDIMLKTDQPVADVLGADDDAEAGSELAPDAGVEDTKINLDAAPDKNVIEAKDNGDAETIEEWENIMNESKAAGIDPKKARKVLSEAFNIENRQIDLTTPYQMVLEGTATFAQFKGTIFKCLNEKNFSEEYKSLVNELRDAGTPDLYEVAMNKIYDYADANDITIKTT